MIDKQVCVCVELVITLYLVYSVFLLVVYIKLCIDLMLFTTYYYTMAHGREELSVAKHVLLRHTSFCPKSRACDSVMYQLLVSFCFVNTFLNFFILTFVTSGHLYPIMQYVFC